LPHTIILREEMSYNDQVVNSGTKRTSSNTKMEVMYMSLLREYFELECESIKSEFLHPFSIENYIDDFIVLTFYIGNDFLHKLYCMNTKKGNFDEIIGIFKKTLAKMDGYITHNGKVNWYRFNILLKEISKRMELKMIKTTADEMDFYLSNIESGKFFDLISDPEQNQYKNYERKHSQEEKENDPLNDSTIKELEGDYSQKFSKIKNELSFLDKITRL